MNILGVDDYGVYSLVAGVVSILSFFTNSLIGSTQRFLSVTQGKGDIGKLKEVFSNSLLLHIGFGLLVSAVLAALLPFMFNGFLNIPIDRIEVAKRLYLLVILMVYTSFIASPYRALLVSHENIVYTSIVDVLDGVLKVVLVLLLPHSPIDNLVSYGLILLGIQIFNLLAFMIFSSVKYDECILPKLSLFSFDYLKELSTFTGWVIYSSVCVTLKMQGLAIVLNKVYGAAMNAAYGIGSQISGMVAFVSSSLNNAIAPQLMAAEGGGDRKRMLALAETQSKMSFMLLALVGVPTMFEMQRLLELWLVEVPQNTALFGCMLLATQIVDMLSIGLNVANKAIGNIGRYIVLTYTPKLLVLPLSWMALKLKMALITVAIIMFSIEALCMLYRIYILRHESWFDAKMYCVSVILKSIPPVIISIITCAVIHLFVNNDIRIICTFLFSMPLFVIVAYTVSLNDRERKLVKSLINKALSRI
jgi:O-antigen/teichoic acid export membrane protein